MEDGELPAFVRVEREALLADIHEVFPGGSREGGVSWSESKVIDMYGSPGEYAIARTKDRDTRWQDLLDDPTWETEPGIGGWSFLDAIGFRYYLPAAMVLAVRQGWDNGILFHLRLPEGRLREWSHDKWSRLNLPQRLCVKRFIEYMSVVSPYRETMDDERGWTAALRSYWGKISEDSPDALPPSPQPKAPRRQAPRA